MKPLTQMYQIKARNEQLGHHWFSPGTLRWFRSRVSQRVYPSADGGAYFVSSERFNDSTPRLYSVRKAEPDGSIDTVGEFQAYRSASGAHAAAKRLAAGVA